jgi:hypothetical protein
MAEGLSVFYDHGRWLTVCPNEPLGSIIVIPEQVTVACPRCGRRWPLSWPAEREEIERICLFRPEARNRSWKPGETVDDLRRENEAHGCFGGMR